MTIEPVQLPEKFTAAWAVELGRRLESATRQGVPLKQVMTPETAEMLFAAVTRLLVKEPTLLEVGMQAQGTVQVQHQIDRQHGVDTRY